MDLADHSVREGPPLNRPGFGGSLLSVSQFCLGPATQALLEFRFWDWDTICTFPLICLISWPTFLYMFSKNPMHFGTLDAQKVFLQHAFLSGPWKLPAWSCGLTSCRAVELWETWVPTLQHQHHFPHRHFYQGPSTGWLISVPNWVCTIYIQGTDWLLPVHPELNVFFITTPFLISSTQDIFSCFPEERNKRKL